MSKKYNKILGKKGEDLAAEYLIANGYSIIDKNFHTRFGEIDIIAKKFETIYIIEVRLRNGLFYGTPEDSLTLRKLKRLRRISLFYLNRFNGFQLFEVEFISVVITAMQKSIRKYNITEKVMSS